MKFQVLLLAFVMIFGMSFADIISCGDVGAGSHTLDTNLTGYVSPSIQHCLRITSPNVTIDCQGRTITGNGTYQGIYLLASYTNVTIKNCFVRNYANGIFSNSTSFLANSLITNNNFTNNSAWDISISDLTSSNITNNHGNTGFLLNRYMGGARTSLISNNTIEPGGSSNCKGIQLETALGSPSNNVILGNTVNGVNANTAAYYVTSDGNLVANNTAIGTDTGAHGFYIEGDWNILTGNLAADAVGSGFYVSGLENLIVNNTARHNALGATTRAGFEIIGAVEYGSGSPTGYGISADGGDFNTVVVGNIAEDNLGNGIYLGGELSETNMYVADNTANGNLVGINVQSYGNVIEDNTAQENIFADMFVGGQDIFEAGPFGMFMASFDPQVCDNDISGTTGSGGRPLLFANDTVEVSGGTYSGIILCDAPGSVLEDVTVVGSDTLSNNGAILIWSPVSTITDSVSHDNMVGFWLYNSPIANISGGSAYNNFAAGYILAGSEGSTLQDLKSYNNYGKLSYLSDFLYPGETLPPFVDAIPFGFGVIEMPAFGNAQSDGMNVYDNIKVYDNAYGMILFSFTDGSQIINSDIYGNRIFGVVDGTQGQDLADASNSRIYKNGADLMDLVMLFNPEPQDPLSTLMLFTMKNGPAGVFQTEYLQASYIAPYLMGIFFGGIGQSPPEWHLDKDRIGPASTGMTISVDDTIDSESYLLTDTNLPAMSRIQMQEYVGVIQYGFGFPGCISTCDEYGYCYDFEGHECGDNNNDSICDYYQYAYSECADEDENGWCDMCDKFNIDVRLDLQKPTYPPLPPSYAAQTDPDAGPVQMASYKDQYLVVASLDDSEDGAPTLDQFAVWWTPSDCYDSQTIGLYYLWPTDLEFSTETPGPGDTVSTNLSGEWLYVEGQNPIEVEGDGIVVEGIQPYLPFLEILPGVDNNYMGIYGLFAVPSECGGDQGGEQSLDISLESVCGQDSVVTVTADGRPVADAHVTVSVGTTMIASGHTGSDGKFSFDNSCGSTVNIVATATGYSRTEDTATLHACDCEPGACTSDEQCPATQQCLNSQCSDVPCECGEVRDHQCVEYECCADADCPQGQNCDSHTCKQKPVEPECKSDSDCGAGEYCALVAGTPGGTCEQVQCGCGKIENHQCVSYECCADSDCAQGEKCVNNVCTQPAGGDVTCPTTGLVGDSKTCTAKEADQPCASCDYQITDPTGKTYNGKTDEDGNFELPLNSEGTYQVTLFKDGQPIKTIEVKSFPRAAPEEPEKPTEAPGLEGYVLWLLLLLVLVVLAVLYWRGAGGKKAAPAGKKEK